MTLQILEPGAPTYPPALLASAATHCLQAIGNQGLLRQPLTALFCSNQCPGSAILRTLDLAAQLRDARVFALMMGLEDGPKQRKASLQVVFRRVVLEGCSQRVVASGCKCVESLISARVGTIERRFGMSVERLRCYASELKSVEWAVKGQRMRRKSAGRLDDFDQPEGGEGEDEGEDFGDDREGQD
jgi:hypothetical protein